MSYGVDLIIVRVGVNVFKMHCMGSSKINKNVFINSNSQVLPESKINNSSPNGKKSDTAVNSAFRKHPKSFW